MDLETTFIAALLVAICIFPFLAIGTSIRKKKKLLFHTLNTFCTQHNNTITHYELCGEIAIALCKESNALVFIKRSKHKEINQIVDLDEIQKCYTLKPHKTVRSKSGNYSVIIQLALSLHFEAQEKPELILEFYNLNDNLQLDGELQLMERWNEIINKALNTRQRPKLESVA
ncbi:hypothetical protein U1E44_03650 [Arenibacter sp. GZD96]|uniref:hypothetical protein n=1 Tax=Aurantibrevibacter litoralis TaxID=3106030 RepID=UPI002AFF6FBB|nr:hypothetical protein [Arenibacter sp. GZD-96]MEA1785173.1 hypothetical protein [Arenibacter sp. GZD-96]